MVARRDEFDDFVLRHADYRLSDVQAQLQESIRTFFRSNCPTEVVRKAEPVGFDDDIWHRFLQLRPIAMGVPEDHDGDGAGLMELAIVAEEVGRAAAPVPFVDTVVAARVLASVEGAGPAAALAAILDEGASAAWIANVDTSGSVLVPGGACATQLVALRGDEIVLTSATAPQMHVANLAAAPMAWWDLSDAAPVATGPQARAVAERADAEVRLLTAAALVGLGQSALDGAVRYAKDREAFGLPIGAFQAVAHPLVDAAIGIESARRMVRRGSWFGDREPEQLATLASFAFLHASRAAVSAGQTAVHTQGGFGFTLESDVQLYLRRAKGWALAIGTGRDETRRLADRIHGPAGGRR
jgi:alkylation response protein AidB-like acyl-CoA dehydrogenase